MYRAGDMPAGVDERIERLICRRLDGEITAGQQAELDRVLAQDAAARALFEAYRRNDALAADALRQDLAGVKPSPQRRRFHGWRLGAAGAVPAAAAVIAFSLLPRLWSTPAPKQVGQASIAQTAMAERPAAIAGDFADYRRIDYRPQRRERVLQRDLIGIRDENKNVIYVFERTRPTTRLIPITGEF